MRAVLYATDFEPITVVELSQYCFMNVQGPAVKYILDNRKPVACDDVREWGRHMEEHSRHVADEMIGAARVSTVFLGLNHRFGDGPPLLFETMVFGGPLDQEQERCSTWEEAEVQHAAMCARVRSP